LHNQNAEQVLPARQCFYAEFCVNLPHQSPAGDSFSFRRRWRDEGATDEVGLRKLMLSDEGVAQYVMNFTSEKKLTERNTHLRIDKYLKVSRLIKRRTLANEVADAGRISVNGRQVKASYEVKVGDEIEIAFGQKPVKVKVASVEAIVGKDVAREMYTVIDG
jgi:ribosomal 50S subunit-recycling heat shock protein